MLFTCWLVEPTSAQTTQASIAGIISDNKKAPLPGATVQVRNESTGFTTGTITNAQGDYSFKELPLGGPYTILATFMGYGEQKRTNGSTCLKPTALRYRPTSLTWLTC